jgi:hypothetical protein
MVVVNPIGPIIDKLYALCWFSNQSLANPENKKKLNEKQIWDKITLGTFEMHMMATWLDLTKPNLT